MKTSSATVLSMEDDIAISRLALWSCTCSDFMLRSSLLSTCWQASSQDATESSPCKKEVEEVATSEL
eukprot:2686400-Amphidinium_carterae.1